MTEQSCILSQAAKLSRSQLNIFEWCSGGFGGWSRATKILQDDGWKVRTTGAADIDPTMMKMWNKNSSELHHEDEHPPQCQQGDITNHEDWEFPIELGSDTLTLSTPCTSFSKGGSQRGWLVKDGQTLAVALLMAQQHGFQLLLVENVANLWLDYSFREQLVKILHFVGYQIISQRIITLTAGHPAERSRLLLVLRQKDLCNETEEFPSLEIPDFLANFPIPRPMNLWTTARWLDPPPEVVIPLILQDDVLKQYCDRKRLPASMKANLQVDAPSEVLWQRTVRTNQIMPAGCLMSRYTRQHEFGPGDVIYGSLRRHNFDSFAMYPRHHQEYRFFHATEMAVSMGQATTLVVPRDCHVAAAAVGNCISEFHALAGVAVAMRLLGNDIDIANLLQVHRQNCITEGTIQWHVDSDWVTIRKVPPVIPMMPANEVDNEHQTKQKWLISDGTNDPLIQISVEDGALDSQVCTAENKLNGPTILASIPEVTDKEDGKSPVDSDDQRIILLEKKLLDTRSSKGLVCHWSNAAFWIDVKPWMFFKDIMHNGRPVIGDGWVDENSETIDPISMIGMTTRIFTKNESPWLTSKCPGEVMIVAMTQESIESYVIKHSEDEIIESLMYAEQILRGPNEKIVSVSSHLNKSLATAARLNEHPIVVLQFMQSHSLLQVKLSDDSKEVAIWIPRGTRAFELVPFSKELVLVDSLGFEIPWDLPIMTNMQICVAKESGSPAEYEISPTVPFESSENPNLEVGAHDTSIREIVKRNAELIQQQIAHAVSVIRQPTGQAMFTQLRLEMLCEWGPPVGDDEMTWFLNKIHKVDGRLVFGVYHWSADSSWTHQHAWEDVCMIGEQQEGLAMWCIQQHWVAIRVTWGDMFQTCYVDYVSDISFRQQVLDDWVCKYVKPSKCEVRHIQVTNVHGWCGFTAMQWMFVDCQAHFPLPTVEEIAQIRDRFVAAVGISKAREYDNLMNGTPDNINHAWVTMIRASFIHDQFDCSTSPLYYGLGDEEKMGPTSLKAMGKIAAILIGKGTSNEESLSVAKAIVDVSVAQAKAISQQKDRKAYMQICEFCVRNDIPLANLSTNQAAQKLQQFFRLKYNQRKDRSENHNLDLTKVQFDPRSFMVMNGEFTPVTHNWTPASRGIAVAQLSDVMKYLEKGELLSNECNTAILSEPVQTTGKISAEAITVEVTDNRKNRAIINATLVHFGSKKVIRVPTVDAAVDAKETATIAIQVYKQMIDNDAWNALLAGPAKTILKAIQPSKEELPILNLWNRRWYSNNTQIEPKLAQEFAILLTVPTEHVNTWLCKSGTQSFTCFVSLRRSPGETGEVESHRIIWIAKNLGDAQAQLGKLESHAGIVYKRPSSYGIRVATAQFESHWATLKGETSLPSMVKSTHKYTIDGLPGGISNVQIEKWADTIEWPVRVLRRINDFKCLVGTETTKPSKDLSLNGHQLLILKYNEQSRPSNPILVGKLETRDNEWAFGVDPWKGAKLGGGAAAQEKTTSSPWGGYVPTTSIVSPPGLSSDSIPKAQSSRMDKIEKEMQDLRESFQGYQKETKDQFTQQKMRSVQ